MYTKFLALFAANEWQTIKYWPLNRTSYTPSVPVGVHYYPMRQMGKLFVNFPWLFQPMSVPILRIVVHGWFAQNNTIIFQFLDQQPTLFSRYVGVDFHFADTRLQATPSQHTSHVHISRTVGTPEEHRAITSIYVYR